MESYCCSHACWHACHCYWSHARGVRSIERWRVCGKHLLGSGFCAAHLVGRSRNLYSLPWRADVAQDQSPVRWPCSHLCDPRVREASASDRLGGTPKGFGCLHCSRSEERRVGKEC